MTVDSHSSITLMAQSRQASVVAFDGDDDAWILVFPSPE